MCGIFGVVGRVGQEEELAARIDAAMARVRYRGPDDAGHFASSSEGIGLGHRRLSIVDLSSAGHQPMHSADGRLVIVFNGEIYNHEALREELKAAGAAPAWRGTSDTETLLAGISHWGVQETLRRCTGMFALAVWDRRDRVLTLARDRFGEKPLYLGRVGASVVFCSDMASLKGWPGFEPRIDREALAAYMQRGWIPAPLTIFEGFAKLPPGHLLEIPGSLAAEGGALPASRSYWSLIDVAAQGLHRRQNLDYEAAVDRVEELLGQAVSRQMVADVPLGAFLSGGIDSSTIVALMQARSSRRIRSFSIGFDDEAYDEAKHAELVARHLGTEHTELYVNAAEALAAVPSLPEFFSEPFADASQLPTLLLSRLTREHVTVALSGDAGDELFGGYSRHFAGREVWRRSRSLPANARRMASRCIEGIGADRLDRAYRTVAPVLPGRLRTRLPGAKLVKLAKVLHAESTRDFYLGLSASWVAQDATQQAPTKDLLPTITPLAEADTAEQMMAWDSLTYLPDDVLVKVDRCSMAASLEVRAPFLDHHLAEFAWTLPLDFKIQAGVGKRVLRSVLERHLPRSLFERPKMGFSPPIDEWLRGSLRDWAENLLSPERLSRGGLLEVEPIRRKWREHLARERNWQGPLWTLLMFLAWREYWGL